MSYFEHPYNTRLGPQSRMRYFQILYRNADGKTALTSSISGEFTEPEECLKWTTDFVRANMIQIYEVLS